MLSENQVKRLLTQCQNVDDAFGDPVPTGMQTEQSINQGWLQALRLVLKEDTYPISNEPLSSAGERPIDEDLMTNCCSAPFTYPGWPDSDMCSKCYEHADVWGIVEG